MEREKAPFFRRGSSPPPRSSSTLRHHPSLCIRRRELKNLPAAGGDGGFIKRNSVSDCACPLPKPVEQTGIYAQARRTRQRDKGSTRQQEAAVFLPGCANTGASTSFNSVRPHGQAPKACAWSGKRRVFSLQQRNDMIAQWLRRKASLRFEASSIQSTPRERRKPPVPPVASPSKAGVGDAGPDPRPSCRQVRASRNRAQAASAHPHSNHQDDGR